MAFLEQCVALKTPVMEAEFALDERSQLSLYDCLVPTLKEHRRFKINLQDNFNINDFKTQQRVKELEWNLHQSRLPHLEKKNEMLEAKVKQLEDELSIVNWYISIMEDGINTKEVVKNYQALKIEHEKLRRFTS